MTVDFDDVLRDVGDYGRYQKLVLWLLLFPLCIPSGIHWFNQIFMQGIPEHRCRIPTLDGDLNGTNFNHPFAKNFVPFETHQDSSIASRCFRLNLTDAISEINASVPEVISCEAWTYERTDYEQTIVTEWNLVCDKMLIPTLTFAVFACGNFVGVFFFGYISDRFGRKKAAVLLLLIQTVFGFLTAMCPNIETWIVCRFLVGTTIPVSYTIGFVMVVELVGPEKRTFATVISNFFCGIGFVSCAGLAYLVRDWRYFAMVTSLPFGIFLIPLYFIPESPRWLLSGGREAEAAVIIQQIAKTNKVKLPEKYLESLKAASVDMLNCSNGVKLREVKNLPETTLPDYSEEPGFRDLLRTPGIRKSVILLSVIWLMIAIAYNGMNYYSPEVGGNPYLSYALTCAVELPANFAVWPLSQRWGRRWTLVTAMVLGGIFSILTIFVPRNGEYGDVLLLVCLLTGKFFATCADIVIYLYSGELLPTPLRSRGIGVVSTMGMLGYIVVPFVTATGRLGPAYVVIPLVAIGSMLVFGAFTNLFLPETLHRKLPESVEECEEQHRALRWHHYLACRVKPPKEECELSDM